MSTRRPLLHPTRFGHLPDDTSKTTYGLSPRLTREARDRLGHMALALSFAAFMGVAMAPVIPKVLGISVAAAAGIAALNSVGLLVNLGLWRITRSPRVRDTVALDLGLLWEVVGCMAVNVHFYWVFVTQLGFTPPVSPVVIWIILQPVLVPTPMRRAVFASIAAGATAPIALLTVVTLTRADVPLIKVVDAAMLPAVAGVLAVYASRLVHRMATEASSAERMGSYRLEERLGEGGMGEVWRATHAMLTRAAAVKLIRPDMLGGGTLELADAALSRFEQEARTTALLRSPHTVEVFDFGRADDGRFYYVMELLDGIDLRSLVERFGALPPARVVWILKQACHSLDEAHAAGLVHRDIKPANLFLCRYGRDYDFVKVLDFGLVHGSTQGVGEDVTHAGVAVGTPAFMAPEMAGSRAVDSRSDLYALGCVAYILLTGEPVFDADSALQTIVRHARDEPVAPSERAPAPVPAALDAIVLACLEKSPEDRIQTARELAERLDAIGLGDAWTDVDAEAWWTEHAQDAVRHGRSRVSDATGLEPTMAVPGLATR